MNPRTIFQYLLLFSLHTVISIDQQPHYYEDVITPSPLVTPQPPPLVGNKRPEDILLSLCPPKLKQPIKSIKKNILIVSTLDGYITALDLNRNGEMVWSLATMPGPMLSSTLSDLEHDERGHLVRLIPSLSGKIYKLKDEMVEPIAMDASSLLFSSLKMQENVALTGGKEVRTLGIDLETGEVQYECGMAGDCHQYGVSSPEKLKDVIVVQRVVQTVRAHVPRTGENKWNFSVSLHDINLYPGVNLCEDVDLEETDNDTVDDIQLKAVVPEGILCASDKEQTEEIIWRRKFQSPLVDVWRIRGGSLEHIDMFSKNTVPKKSVLLDDDDDVEDDDSPELYIGIHKKQLYIQESILMHKSTDDAIRDYMLNPDITDISMPRVQWKPYLVSPSRTPYYDHGLSRPDLPLLTTDHTLEGDTVTALAIMDNKAQYPYDAGYYLYSRKEENEANFTNLQVKESATTDESVTVVTVVEYVYTNMWHWWKEIFGISVLTAVMMNILITRPIMARMRDNFQHRSRELAQQFLEKQNSLQGMVVRDAVIEKVVEVPVSLNSFPQTPSTGSEPSFPSTLADMSRQNSDFTSRFTSDFQPVQCLGRGGFGVVFECKNKYDDINYAVKRITLPSTDENRNKVKREVKLHAKLDHRNVVRYYSTWEESPPPGWQEERDGWFADKELGSRGPTSEQSVTDISFSLSRDQGSKHVKSSPVNPLSPFESLLNSGFSVDNSISKASDSFAIQFENSSDSQVPASPISKYHVVESKSKLYHSDSSSDSDNVSGYKSDDEHSDIDDIPEESSGGIMFENTGKSEAVTLDMSGNESDDENSDDDDGDHSTKSVSCVEAIEWDKKSKDNNRTLRETKQKSYMYIVMQLCLKETLRDWLKLSTDREKTQIYNIFHQICSGVEYVHTQKLVHRDLKPSNIYFSSEGVIKIGDFGLVTDDKLSSRGDLGEAGDHQHDHHHHGQHTDQVGTLTYMSPEQLLRKPYSHKVDIYSMGLVLLELLVPFTTQVIIRTSLLSSS